MDGDGYYKNIDDVGPDLDSICSPFLARLSLENYRVRRITIKPLKAIPLSIFFIHSRSILNFNTTEI